MPARTKRPHLTVVLVAAGLVALLAAAAIVLAVGQARARDGLTDRLQERTATMARFVRSTYAESFRGRPAQARTALGGGRTPAQALRQYASQVADPSTRLVLLDGAGRIIAARPARVRPSERRAARMPFVAAARRSGWAISGALAAGGATEFDVAAHARTAQGDFVFVDTGPIAALEQFFKPLLAAAPGTAGGAAYLLDDTGRAIAATTGRPGSRPSPRLRAAAAAGGEGRLELGGVPVRFAAVQVPGVGQQVIVTAPEHALLASASGVTRWLPWLLLGALAALGGGTITLLRRVVRRTDELVATSAAKTEFLAAASHELRTPLNGIIGFSQLLHDEKLGPVEDEQREALADILVCGEHLLEVVTGLLDVTRVESGTIELHPGSVRIDELMHDVSAGLAALAGTTLVRIEVDVDPELPHSVLLDQTRLRQVLFNYVSNALKHSAPGERVLMRARREGAAVRFEVHDDGPGVPADAVDRLFTRYGRVPGSPEGTGLGLAVTRHIVEAHGGTVGVDTRPGEGATFWATLPLVPAEPLAAVPTA